jgi:hypothetical protein
MASRTNGITAEWDSRFRWGNDIVGDQFAIYLDYCGKALDPTRFQGALDLVRASYMDLFALRDVVANELNLKSEAIPIFGHCYDYGIPDGMPAGKPIPFAGPWLKPPLESTNMA